MTEREMIYQRKSCRLFTRKPVEEALLEKIRAYGMKSLYPNIKVRWDTVSREQVKCICPWTTAQLIAVYSEETDGYLENAGFLFQQMDLYLHTLGLGVCWLGMGKMNPDTAAPVEGMKFVILLAFGYPGKEQLRQTKEFKRKPLGQITDRSDPRLEPARLAPSSINSQPWYFTHEGDVIHAYRTEKGVTGGMNRIDMGIALAHLYVANADTFRFFRSEDAPRVPGYAYTGSMVL